MSDEPTPSTPSGGARAAQDNPLAGVRYALAGFKLIRAKGVRRFVAVPLLIDAALFTIAIAWAWARLSEWRAAVEGWLPGWLDVIALVLVPLFFLTVLVVLFFGFALLANLIAAPFNGLLASAVERRLRSAAGPAADDPGLSWVALGREIGASVRSELRKLAYFLPRALALLLLYLVPVVNIAAPLGWLLFSAWMLALSYLDYPMANHGLDFKAQRLRVRQWRLTSLGFGATVMAALLIPLVNLFAIPAAVAGATLMWVERLSDSGPEPGPTPAAPLPQSRISGM